MRFSTKKEDKGYGKDYIKTIKCVYLDGMKIPMVFTADEELGYIKKYKGECQADIYTTDDGEIAWEKLYGEVVVAFKPNVEIITDEIDVLVMDISANLSFLEREVEKLKKLNEKEN